MLNHPDNYRDTGHKCARATYHGDAACAQFMKDGARAMWCLETLADKVEARRLFDEAYRETSQKLRGAALRLA